MQQQRKLQMAFEKLQKKSKLNAAELVAVTDTLRRALAQIVTPMHLYRDADVAHDGALVERFEILAWLRREAGALQTTASAAQEARDTATVQRMQELLAKIRIICARLDRPATLPAALSGRADLAFSAPAASSDAKRASIGASGASANGASAGSAAAGAGAVAASSSAATAASSNGSGTSSSFGHSVGTSRGSSGSQTARPYSSPNGKTPGGSSSSSSSSSFRGSGAGTGAPKLPPSTDAPSGASTSRPGVKKTRISMVPPLDLSGVPGIAGAERPLTSPSGLNGGGGGGFSFAAQAELERDPTLLLTRDDITHLLRDLTNDEVSLLTRSIVQRGKALHPPPVPGSREWNAQKATLSAIAAAQAAQAAAVEALAAANKSGSGWGKEPPPTPSMLPVLLPPTPYPLCARMADLMRQVFDRLDSGNTGFVSAVAIRNWMQGEEPAAGGHSRRNDMLRPFPPPSGAPSADSGFAGGQGQRRGTVGSASFGAGGGQQQQPWHPSRLASWQMAQSRRQTAGGAYDTPLSSRRALEAKITVLLHKLPHAAASASASVAANSSSALSARSGTAGSTAGVSVSAAAASSPAADAAGFSKPDFLLLFSRWTVSEFSDAAADLLLAAREDSETFLALVRRYSALQRRIEEGVREQEKERERMEEKRRVQRVQNMLMAAQIAAAAGATSPVTNGFLSSRSGGGVGGGGAVKGSALLLSPSPSPDSSLSGLNPSLQALLSEKDRRVAEDSERERREAQRAAEVKRKEEREAQALEEKRRRALIEMEIARMPARKQAIASDLSRDAKCTRKDREEYEKALRGMWERVGAEARALARASALSSSSSSSSGGSSSSSSASASVVSWPRGIVAFGPLELSELSALQSKFHISRARNQAIVLKCGLTLERDTQITATSLQLPPLIGAMGGTASSSGYLDSEPQCVNCLLQSAVLMTRECGHLAYCDRCAHTLLSLPPHVRSCVVCRQPVSSLVATRYGVPLVQPHDIDADSQTDAGSSDSTSAAGSRPTSAQSKQQHQQHGASTALGGRQARQLWLHTHTATNGSQEEKQQQQQSTPSEYQPRRSARSSSITSMHWA